MSKLLKVGIPALIWVALAACTATIPSTTSPATPGVTTESVAESASVTETAGLSVSSTDVISENVGNLTYTGIYTDAVTLEDGTYTGEPFVPGSASRPTVNLAQVAVGDLNGDGVQDAAVVLKENSGGSGSFVYLAAVIDDAGSMANVATALLGDRWEITNLTITDGHIILDALRPGANDPLCCPSEKVSQRYMLQDGQLMLLEETVTREE